MDHFVLAVIVLAMLIGLVFGLRRWVQRYRTSWWAGWGRREPAVSLRPPGDKHSASS
jgi:hypothetical protein